MFLSYILKRSFATIPAVLILAMIIFLLKTAIPDEIVERHFQESIYSRTGISERNINQSAREIRSELKLDLPLFYLSFQSAVIPDSIHTMYPLENAEFYRNLLVHYGCEEQTANYYRALLRIKESRNEKSIAVYNELFGEIEKGRIRKVLAPTSMDRGLIEVTDAFEKLVLNQSRMTAAIPAIRWHGSDNQFHHWFWNFIQLDFGKSIIDDKRVSDKMLGAVTNTLMITIPALTGIFLICIPLGVWLSGNKSKRSSVVNTVLYGLDALPLFWLSLILIILFASNSFLNIFPAFGFTLSALNGQNSYFRMAGLILPVSALILSSLAYVSKQVSKSIADEQKQLYVLAAKARGLSEKSVLWVHIFKNSLITIITIFSDYLTAIFAGSFIVEVIFSIPGMGKLLFDSVLNKDFPVILAILMLTAIIKIFSHLLADIGYKVVNPAIKY